MMAATALVSLGGRASRRSTQRFTAIFRTVSSSTLSPGDLQSSPSRPFDSRPADGPLYDAWREKDACGVGFIADLTAVPTRETVSDAVTMLTRMTHRGGCLSDKSGDGAGICVAMPDDFMRSEAGKLGIVLPHKREYAVGQIFFTKNDDANAERCQIIVEEAFRAQGLQTLGWRDVPTDNSNIGKSARECEPLVRQVFVSPDTPTSLLEKDFTLKLYLARKRILKETLAIDADAPPMYVCSLSNRTIVYKGMLLPAQLPSYYHDVGAANFKSHIATVHSRFSTNTFPSWSRAHPYRYLCHNGEINTVRGNINWMRAREGLLKSEGMEQFTDIVEPASSDSQAMDTVFELLLHSGRTLADSAVMLIPEAWQNNEEMSDELRSLFKYNACVMEPWDGPALVMFTDGDQVGATIDRNGLRPCRYYLTEDDKIICSSEVGVVPSLKDSNVKAKRTLNPGELIVCDFKRGTGEVVVNTEVKRRLAAKQPYAAWLKRNEINLSDIVYSGDTINPKDLNGADNIDLKVFGYTEEDLHMLLGPMADTGYEALGSMGNDTALACLSTIPRLVFDYFKQIFAQVTNPPIDPLRESLVMSLAAYVGPEGNVMKTSPSHARRLRLDSPILKLDEMQAIKHGELPQGWRTKTIDFTYPRSEGTQGLLATIHRVCSEAEQSIKEGYTIICLSDRAFSSDRVPVSSLLATGAVHQHLINCAMRSSVALMVEAGEAREVHHFCTLLGYGADGVSPYMAFRSLRRLADEGLLSDNLTIEAATKNYITAANNGILKVMAKMGVTTLPSYKGAQLFEAVGLGRDVIDLCFTGTASRLGGMSFDILAKDYVAMHNSAYFSQEKALADYGTYNWRAGERKEVHLNQPDAVVLIQEASRDNSRKAYKEFSELHWSLLQKTTLRGRLLFNEDPDRAIPLDQVEPAAEIVKRFRTGAMSYGSISLETHKAIASAMNRMGGLSNSGEGGEDKERMIQVTVGDNFNSGIKQVASGRFGVTIEYLSSAKELQIKMAQGAKPGEGGELPGWKITEEIAKTRQGTVGVGLISPPPHHDIYSIEDLAQLIYDLRQANPKADVSVKLVSLTGVGVIASGVAKCQADHILISGHDGGTGAARWTSIKHAGLPWELGIAEAHHTLVLNGLRGNVSLETDGNIRTGREIVIAAMLGAEHFGMGTAPLIALGCIMMRKCHLNTCPVGIATQDPVLRAKFKGKPEHLINYLFLVAEEVREILARLGIRSLAEAVGRNDLLTQQDGTTLDLSAFFTPTTQHGGGGEGITTETRRRVDGLKSEFVDSTLDLMMIRAIDQSLGDSQQVFQCPTLDVTNEDRSVGGMLSNHITRLQCGRDLRGTNTLKDDKYVFRFQGAAGQSFGCWLTRGLTFELEGDSNDYTGKGLSGGTIVVHPSRDSTFEAQDNLITGNAGVFGATSGRAFFRGRAGMRFCVRNSGALVVVEGVGDHGCEYMTGGRVVVLGPTGKNFGAGMSGGVAYVYDPDGDFKSRCNLAQATLEEVVEDSSWDRELRVLVSLHYESTESTIARQLLLNWVQARKDFRLFFPIDYRTALRFEQRIKQKSRLPESPLPLPQTRGMMKDPDKDFGFMLYGRKDLPSRPATDRLTDWDEIYMPKVDEALLRTQAARCMDCSTPYCQSNFGCPLGNPIPNFNKLVHANDWKRAWEKLRKTNPFPEWTGRVCPAPCEGSCTLGLIDEAVTIKNIESAIADRAFEEGWEKPEPPSTRTGKRVAIVGSGPAGCAAAYELNKMGHWVTVFERDEKPGGLMMYGVPNMKADKGKTVLRRLAMLEAEGVEFRCGEAGNVTPERAAEMVQTFDVVVLAVGATVPRELEVPGKDLHGVHYAMEYLQGAVESMQDNDGSSGADRNSGVAEQPKIINAAGKNVVVIGAGDTGTDCIGTAVRQGAKSIVNIHYKPQRPAEREKGNAWPHYPDIHRVDYGHAEAASKQGRDPREWSVVTKEVIGDAEGRVIGVKTVEALWDRDENGKIGRSYKEIAGTEKIQDADLVFVATGFVAAETDLASALNLAVDKRGNFKSPYGQYNTRLDKVFVAGDCRRGQSLVVWAIAEGRQVASRVNKYLADADASTAMRAGANENHALPAEQVG